MDRAGREAKPAAQECGGERAPAGFRDGYRDELVAGEALAQRGERRARIVALDHDALGEKTVLDRRP